MPLRGSSCPLREAWNVLCMERREAGLDGVSRSLRGMCPAVHARAPGVRRGRNRMVCSHSRSSCQSSRMAGLTPAWTTR